jgi:hypothetical protein
MVSPGQEPVLGDTLGGVELVFRGEVIWWRGPAPFHFVVVPDDPSAAIEALSPALTYGWGAIPARVRIGETDFRTALFPKDGRYLVPVKIAVRRAEGIELGDVVSVRLGLDA